MQEQCSLDSSADDAPLQLTGQVVLPFVRQSLASLSAMSVQELREYINQCAFSFVAAQRRWEQTGNFADVGERDACWCAEADALIELGSRPGAVARIKVEGVAC